MTKHYTELTGASGAQIQFGLRLHEANELFGKMVPKVRLGLSSAELKAISSLAITFSGSLPAGVLPAGEEEVLRLEIFQGDKTLVARDVSTPQRLSGDLWECSFVDQAIDLDELIRLNACAVAAQTTREATQPRASDVSVEYRAFCADVLDYLGTIRSQLERDVAPLMGSLSPEEIADLDREMKEGATDQWALLTRRANQLLLPIAKDKDALVRHKRYTENTVTRELRRNLQWEHAFVKPMGYPGDYQSMNVFYDQVITGDDPYNRFLGAVGLLSGEPVASRMQRLVQELREFRAAREAGEHLHIMSIGSGSAREVREFFRRGYGAGASYSFTLVDQEEQALEYALPSIYGGIPSGLSSVMVSGMNTSFMEMLRPTQTFRHLPPQDFIYSAGLTDYLSERLTRSLVAKLYDYLKPGGSVLIGNINDDMSGMFWSAECVLDWTMYFRSLNDMERIADGLEGEVSIDLDPSGSYYMLKVTKPA